MRLAELLTRLHTEAVAGPTDREVRDVAFDSRRVAPDSVFVALPGTKTNGNRFVRDAIDRGALAIVSELDPPPAPFSLTRPGGKPLTWVRVADATTALGSLAASFYGRPSERLTVVGVTGTNGKTTTTYLLESVFSCAGHATGVLGTVNYRLKGRPLEAAPNTTPLSADLQRLLARMLDAGASHVAMEVSSHALALKRVDDVDFDAAVFTNLTRDHLDYHGTREAYLDAKARLFELLTKLPTAKRARVAVLNRDDASYGRLKHVAEPAKVVSYGLSEGADFLGAGIAASLNGTHFRLAWGGRERTIGLRLIGEHNVYNALGAAAAALSLDVPEQRVVEGLQALALVPGRLEPVEAGQTFRVLVDYAHTDSALDTVLSYLKRIPHRRLVTVFGCGGDRDTTKRGPMGLAATAHSDFVYITSDNPRTEDPLRILRQIEEGIEPSGRKNYKIVPDREAAIQEAVRDAQEGDVVLIAGKGHEATQILKDRAVHFDDREAARSAIRRRLKEPKG
ncbi:MAG: UDP-N-acetylmuramoyl-L-alanyl-D-glutamate--2,6-diaminopimelate ligase [Elusimicrobia bacterium]|nr:UDP-N-acetylmuramoyl-L-alanyl-D-glutamate--2,6-diaminopimelate ligase [Elusimicrobiota bacterium]